jgi:hypothetical protein
MGKLEKEKKKRGFSIESLKFWYYGMGSPSIHLFLKWILLN